MFLRKKKVDRRDNSNYFPELIMHISDEAVLHKKRPLDYSHWNTPWSPLSSSALKMSSDETDQFKVLAWHYTVQQNRLFSNPFLVQLV